MFYLIEQLLDRYLTKELAITKEVMAHELTLSIPAVKKALRELKQKGYIKAKNANSPIISIGEYYQYKENFLNEK